MAGAPLIPTMAVGDVTDVSPWSGWEVDNTGEDVVLGPIESPAGSVTLSIASNVLAIRKGGALLFETDLPGLLTDLRLEPGRVFFNLQAAAQSDSFLRLPPIPGPVLLATAGGRDLNVAVEPDGIRLTGFPLGDGPMAVDVVW